MPARSNQTNQGTQQKLSPELVKAISERVYALLQADLRRERERARRSRMSYNPAARP